MDEIFESGIGFSPQGAMFHLDMPIGDKKISVSRTEDTFVQINTILGSLLNLWSTNTISCKSNSEKYES